MANADDLVKRYLRTIRYNLDEERERVEQGVAPVRRDAKMVSVESINKAVHHAINVRLGRNDEFIEQPFAMRLRLVYLSTYTQIVLRVLSIVYLLLVLGDDLYTCSPNPSYATKCERVQEVSISVQVCEIGIMFVFIVALGAQLRYKARHNLLLVGVFASCWISLLTFVISKVTNPELTWAIRASLRPLPFLYVHRGTLNSLNQMVQLIPCIWASVTMLAAFVVIFALVGHMLASDLSFPGHDYSIDGNGFHSIWGGIVTCFWWAFTTNGPEPGNQEGAPGIKESAFWAVYWIVYTIITVFYVIQIITAEVYDHYIKLNEKYDKQKETFLNQELDKIYKLLGGLQAHQAAIDQFLEKLQTAYSCVNHVWSRKYRSTQLTRKSLTALLLSESGTIDDGNHGEQTPSLLHKVRNFICSEKTATVFHALALANLILLLAGGKDAVSNERVGDSFVSSALFVLFITYVIDFTITFCSFGGPLALLYMPPCAAKLRMITTLACFITLIVQLTAHTSQTLATVPQLVHFQSFMLIHLVGSMLLVKAFQEILYIFILVAPSIANLLAANLAIMYSVSVIGVYLVGGEYVLTNQALQNYTGGTMFTQNFNTVPQGLYTLFMAIYGNNMNQISQPLFIVGGWPMLIIFSTFFLIATLITTNILISVVIDLQAEIAAKRRKNIASNAVQPVA